MEPWVKAIPTKLALHQLGYLARLEIYDMTGNSQVCVGWVNEALDKATMIEVTDKSHPLAIDYVIVFWN
jgi:hypothetical protein